MSCDGEWDAEMDQDWRRFQARARSEGVTLAAFSARQIFTAGWLTGRNAGVESAVGRVRAALHERAAKRNAEVE